MTLTVATDYGLAALLVMARHRRGPVASDDLARLARLPLHSLRRVTLWLTDAGLLVSSRHPGGGYRLARAARRITLLEVVEILHGPVQGEVPRWTDQAAGVLLDDRLLEACGGAAEVVRRRLRRVTLAELPDGEV